MEQSIWVSGTRYVGFKVTHWVSEVGRVTLMYGDMIRSALGKLPSYRVTIDQMGAIGVGSLGLVIVVSLFTGAVAAVQAAYQFSNVVPLKYLGAVILRSTIIELGPVLTALVVGGRVGAAIRPNDFSGPTQKQCAKPGAHYPAQCAGRQRSTDGGRSHQARCRACRYCRRAR